MRTLGLAGMAAGACLVLAVVLGYATRSRAAPVTPRSGARSRPSATRFLARCSRSASSRALGGVDAAWRAFAGGEGLWLQGTVFALLFGYVARFLAVAHAGAGRLRAHPALARGSGALARLAARELVTRLHLPLLGAGVGTALLLVFVDVMKEMPITLMTRPFGWDTLAVRVFEMTAEGEWQRAALPALAIVAAGLLPVALLTWRMERAARAA